MFGWGHKKYEHDDRIVVVSSVEDIPKCGQAFRFAHGVLCPLTLFTPKEKDEIADFMRAKMDKGEWSIYADHYKGFRARRIPPALHNGFAEIQKIFRQATGRDCRPLMRANSSFPTQPHEHNMTLTYTFTGTGTIGVNRAGERYAAPQDHLFFFHNIPHMASNDFTPEQIKLTILTA